MHDSDAELEMKRLAAEDYERWLPLWQAYQRFYKADLPEEVTRTSFSRMLDPNEPMFGALAVRSRSAIGMVHWIFHRSNWSIGNYCYLQDLFVSDQNRGAGAGRLLIEHVYKEARKAKCSRVYWLTHETNQPAMLLYDRIAERSGFVQYRKVL
jgi:GNAT superfamily N-acetyltransferase